MSTVTLPRIQIPLTVGGDKVSAEWYRWAHDLTLRAGGVTGQSTAEIAAALGDLAQHVEGVESQAIAAGAAVNSVRREVRLIEVPEPLWNSIVARIIRLERHVSAIEEMPL